MREEKSVQERGVIHNVQDGVLRIEFHSALVVISYFERFAALDYSGHQAASGAA